MDRDRQRDWDLERPRRPGRKDCKDYSGNDGMPGERGEEAAPATTNVSGAKGNASIQNVANQNDDFYAEHLTPLAGRMFLREAIMAHLNGRHTEAAHRLVWLHTLLGPDTPRMQDSSLFVDADLPNEKVVPDIEFDVLRRQTAVQLHRLRMGLDAYGNSPSFVPMLNYKAYDDYIRRWLDSARRVEGLHEQYYRAGRSQEQRLEDVRTSLKNLDLSIANLGHDITTFEQSRKQLQDDILRLLLDADRLYAELLNSESSFKQAVAAEAGCDFMDVIKAVGTIAALAKGSVAAIAAIKPILDAIGEKNPPKRDDKDDRGKLVRYFDGISEKFSVAEGKAKDIQKAYGEIKGLLDRNGNLSLPSDRAKIITERDEIAKTVEKFRHLPEAQKYLQAVDSFIAVVTARNSKIVEHDVLALKTAEAEGKISQAKADKINIQDTLSREFEPSLPVYEEFMARNLDMHKIELVRALYYAQRALAYMTLTDEQQDLARETVAHLEHTHRLLNEKLIRAKESKGRSHQVLEFGHHMGTFSLKSLVGEKGLQKLKDKARVAFSIPDDAFPDYYHVYATRARVHFNGITHDAKRPPGIRLIHSGHGRFFDRDEQIREFEHAARNTTVYADGVANLGGAEGHEEEFIALAPYGPWSADIALGANKGIDFAALDDISIEFELKYMPKF